MLLKTCVTLKVYVPLKFLLQHYFHEEAKGNEVAPKRAHGNALKTPKREVSLIATKVLEITKSLNEAIKTDSVYKSLFIEVMKSLAQHLFLPLKPISVSSAVALEYPPVLKLC